MSRQGVTRTGSHKVSPMFWSYFECGLAKTVLMIGVGGAKHGRVISLRARVPGFLQ